MMDVFKVEYIVFGYLEDPQVPGLLVQLAKESLREEGRTIDTVKKRLWDFLKQRFGSRYFHRYSDARGWVGGLGGNNYGLWLYVRGKINIILSCIRWEGRLDRLRSMAACVVGRRINQEEDVEKLEIPDVLFDEIREVVKFYSSEAIHR